MQRKWWVLAQLPYFPQGNRSHPGDRLPDAEENPGSRHRQRLCGQGWLEDKKQRVQLNGQGSGWTEARSGVSQGSVLGPLLFTIFIDNIGEEVLWEISKFTDDTKTASRINNFNDIRSMQRSLDKLVAWANKWEM